MLRVGLFPWWCWVLLGCVCCTRGAERGSPREPAASVTGTDASAPDTPQSREASSSSAAAVVGPETVMEAGAPSASPRAAHRLGAPGAPPARGCKAGQELELRDQTARVWVVASDAEPQFLVLRADRRALEWWRGEPPAQHAARSFEAPIARLSVLREPGSAQSYSAVFVDDKGKLARVRYEQGQLGAPQALAQDADRRFDPALAFAGKQLLVAFTRTVDETMHTFVLRPGGPAQDVTPPGHGASAASFVLGVEPPILVMIDARGGVSPLLELPFDAAGKPGAAIVRTPVSQPYAPPSLSAVAVPGGELEVAFTAIGKLAATAVGRVPLRRAEAPSALHPSRGYGQLSLASARGARAVVHALEVPSDAGKDAPHQIELKWLDARGEGDGLTLPVSAESARQPSIVALGRGLFELAFVRGSRARALLLACDD